MSFSNCETKLMLTRSRNCVICEANGATAFAITDTKLYVPVATLSTKDNRKLL